MPHPTAYLAYDGTCAEAMRFYEGALDARLEVLMTNGESPMAEHFPPEAAHRVLHARLSLPGGGTLMAGDSCVDTPYEGVKGVSLAIDYPTVAEAERVFSRLAEGGQVTMPMQPSFWAKSWGMLVDRFGVNWIVNGELQPY